MFSLSGFAELLKHLPRRVFDHAVQRHEADKHSKGFNSWQQLVVMLYAQLAGLSSLRSLIASFNAHPNHHYHLGCKTVARSTLSDANSQGDWRVFQAVAEALMQGVSGKIARDGKDFMRLIDSTSFTLKGPGFDEWTLPGRVRPGAQGMKLHVVYSPGKQAPLACELSSPRLNDLNYARELALEAGCTYVFDKAYCDYNWWWQMTQQGVKFVTRLKKNASVKVLSERRIARAARGIILKDEKILLANKNPGAGRKNLYSKQLRRIEVWRENEPALVLGRNDLKSSSLNNSEQYKARWQIELYFKWIKQ